MKYILAAVGVLVALTAGLNHLKESDLYKKVLAQKQKARDEEIFLQDRDNRGSIFDNMEEREQREQDAGQMAEFLGRAKNH